ncbi:hypothetical protein BJF78_20040 [Pseudonocardia sp. CNS-139]|nr:hypothetical protein BJF78_20040 [Pseudonocardia sp. CNS-139]
MRIASDADAAADWGIAADLLRAADEFGRGNALAAAALTAGDMTRDEYDEYVRSVGAYQSGLDAVTAQLPEADRTRLTTLRAGEQWQQVAAASATVLAAGYPGAATPGLLAAADVERWGAATETVVSQMMQLGLARSTAVAEREAAEAGETAGASTLTAVAMLAGLVALVLFAFVLANRMIGRLVRLHRETLALSERVLPGAVARLRAGEQVDIEKEIPQLDHGADEIGQVASAFNQAQRTAVQAAVEEARTRAASARRSSTSPAAARRSCTGRCRCWTGSSARRPTPTSWSCCSSSTTSPPANGATRRT